MYFQWFNKTIDSIYVNLVLKNNWYIALALIMYEFPTKYKWVEHDIYMTFTRTLLSSRSVSIISPTFNCSCFSLFFPYILQMCIHFSRYGGIILFLISLYLSYLSVSVCKKQEKWKKIRNMHVKTPPIWQ